MGDPVAKQPATPEILRERVVGVVISLDKAEVIANWMLEKIEKFRKERDRILEQMGGEDNDQGTQPKQFGPDSTE